MENGLYIYRALVVKVVDGDTVDVEVDLGFDVVRRERLRLIGIDAPEKNNPDVAVRAAAARATVALAALLCGYEPGEMVRPDESSWVSAGDQAALDIASRKCMVVIRTIKDKGDKYGRMLATVMNRAGIDVNAAMVAGGYAEPFAPKR